MKCDVLSLSLCSSGRDIDIVEPILIYLEKRYGTKIVRASAYNYAYSLLYFRPRVLVLPNTTGSSYYYFASKYASHLGIMVVALESEGTHSAAEFTDREFARNYFFGLNTDKVLYEDAHLVWNQDGIELAKMALTEDEYKKVKICGATLFDKYRIFKDSFTKKDFFYKKKIKNYSKMCLITTWCFSLNYGGFFENNKESLVAEFGGEEWVDFHRRNGILLHGIYEKIIKKYTDVMFVIKIHPNELDYYEGICPYTEYFGLEKYDNVHVVKPYTDNILELISAANVVLSYDSTTGMEAWLMNTPVIFINPETERFPRGRFYKGVAIANNYEAVEEYLSEVFSTGKLIAFEEKYNEQEKISKEIMTYCDGKNHIRAAECIREFLESDCSKNKDISLWDIKETVKGLAKRVINYKTTGDIYNKKERNEVMDMYANALSTFYCQYGYKV